MENQYKRVVPYDGNPQALKVLEEVFELRPHFEWRGLGFISHSGLKLNDAYADFDTELRFRCPGIRVADPKACQCGEVLKGVIRPWECKVFGTACTPERPIGTCMVSSEGACAAYYNFGRFARERAVGVSCSEEHALGDDRAGACQAAAVPRRPHHHGPWRRRQGDPGAGRGTARAELRHDRAGRRARSIDGLALTTDSFVVKPIRFPGGSIGELAINGTVNDLAMAGARPLALTLSMVLEEGLGADELRAEVEAIATAAETAPASRSWAATPR